MLKATPFHARTAPLCVSHAWRRWAGYVVASSYQLSHEHEYHAIRGAAALFDVSPLYKYLIRGPDAAPLLDLVATRRVSALKVGQVAYTPWCDAAGKVLDDGTVARLGDESFRLTAAEPNLRWLQDNAEGMDVTVEDVSESLAALSLQGPAARAILGDVDLRYFWHRTAQVGGIPVSISRTGYTGDLGYELWVAVKDAVPLWDALIEAGLMLIDVDYVPARKALIPAQTSSPYELDLGWTVDLKKERFIGRQALAAEAKAGAQWRFVGVEIEWDSLERLHAELGLATRLPPVAWRMSVPIYSGGEQVGYATSGGWSPLLKKYLALAHLRAPWTGAGTQLEIEITVEHRRKRARARVAKKPFFDPERKRG